jgi:hypothetical protein
LIGSKIKLHFISFLQVLLLVSSLLVLALLFSPAFLAGAFSSHFFYVFLAIISWTSTNVNFVASTSLESSIFYFPLVMSVPNELFQPKSFLFPVVDFINVFCNLSSINVSISACDKLSKSYFLFL